MQLPKIILCVFVAFTAILSCKKADEFKKYTAGGEIIYTGRPDSVQVYPGKNRVALSWLLISDPTIVKSKVYWNNHKDSAELAVVRGSGTDTIRMFINHLPEDNYDFEIYNYDKQGHSSVKVQVPGTVYGDIYTASLLNRAITDAGVENNTATVTWGNVAASAGVIAMQLSYTDTLNLSRDTVIPAVYEGQVTLLPRFQPGSTIRYRTLFKPAVLAIDTFYSRYDTIPVKADVTALYLKNPGAPFLRDDTQYYDWRWGQLLNWQYNAAAGNNHTYDAINGSANACFTIWIWGNGPLVNGKIYQTVALPAGDYVFNATVSNIDNWLESTYLTVAYGSALPNVEDISTALAYGQFTDNSKTLVSASFTLPASATVTLGVVGSLANPTAQTLRISKVTLVKYK